MRARNLIILILFIIIGVVIWWIFSKAHDFSNESFTSDDVVELLNSMKEKTGIGFGLVEDTGFEWNIEGNGEIGSVFIEGKGFRVDGITIPETGEIGFFFEENGFKMDSLNIAAGTVVGLTGHQKGNLICITVGEVTGGEKGLSAEMITNDIEVKCGVLSE